MVGCRSRSLHAVCHKVSSPVLGRRRFSVTDRVSHIVRSRMMAGVRGKDTKPEMQVRRFLHAHGYRYLLHKRDLPGCPDLVLPKYRAVVFVHGCFWHAHSHCQYATVPATRRDFWVAKLEANRSRDELAVSKLLDMKWRVAIVWECALRRSPERTLKQLCHFLESCRMIEEFSWAQEASME